MKKISAQVVPAKFVDYTLIPYLDSAWNCVKFFCKELPSGNLLKTHRVKSLASFDYSILFTLPKKQVALCYGYQSTV